MLMHFYVSFTFIIGDFKVLDSTRCGKRQENVSRSRNIHLLGALINYVLKNRNHIHMNGLTCT